MNKVKNYPDNPHHNGYSVDIGWEYLGSDDNYDYYVNHKRKYLSIVFGPEGRDYMSTGYQMLIDGDYSKHPYYELLRQLIKENA